jgi:hypothetical protein
VAYGYGRELSRTAGRGPLELWCDGISRERAGAEAESASALADHSRYTLDSVDKYSVFIRSRGETELVQFS